MPIITPEYNFYNWSDLNFPTIEPSLRLDFANARALDSRITFTRASTATYVGADGLIKTAGVNEPRFDHDPTTGESLGLLIEESRTNILKATSTFTNSGGYWTIGGNRASQGSDQTAPDGTSSAFNIVYNGTAGDANIYYSDAGNNGGGEAPTSNSTVYTLSVFAKIPSGNSYIDGVRIRTYNTNHSGQFNLSTGTIVGTSEGATTNRIEAYPNGWYRCSITFTSGTDGNQGVQLYLFNSTNNTALDNSSANGESLYLWGAQMEAGSFPTSYIPTSASTVTRAKDDALISGGSFESWINKNEGTWLIDFRLLGAGAGLLSISGTGGSVNERYMMWNIATDGEVSAAVVDGGVLQTNNSISFTPGQTTQFTKAIFAAKDNDFAITANGLTPVTDTSGTVYNSPSQLRFAYGGGSSTPSAHFKTCIYYPKRLTNVQLQTLTQ